MKSLFDNIPDPVFLNLPEAEVIYYPHFFDKEEADIIYAELTNEIPWQQDEITVYGKKHLQPQPVLVYLSRFE